MHPAEQPAVAHKNLSSFKLLRNKALVFFNLELRLFFSAENFERHEFKNSLTSKYIAHHLPNSELPFTVAKKITKWNRLADHLGDISSSGCLHDRVLI